MLALFGIFMPSFSWHWVLFVWAYALVWFLLSDRVKLLAYRILDPVSGETVAPTGTTIRAPGSSTGIPNGVAHASTVAPFHSDADPEHPVSRDSSAASG